MENLKTNWNRGPLQQNQPGYFYGPQAEQFPFYRIPKALFQEERFQRLSAEAKMLYGILLDRMSLSLKNGWILVTLSVNNRYTFRFSAKAAEISLGQCSDFQ